MKRRLFLHAGAHRTATTSIQSFLRLNFDPLLAAGYFNPRRAGRSHLVFAQIFKGELDVLDLAQDITRRADTRPAPVHSVILSDEDICMHADLSPLGALTERFDVKVVFSMRRQDLWLESWHQQNVKWQWNPALAHLTFPEFLDRREDFHWIRYDSMVDRFAALFGAENLILRVFEKSEMPDGPVAAFCTDIGLTDLSPFTMPAPMNASMAPVCSELLRTLPLDAIKADQRALIERAAFAMDRHVTETFGPSPSLLMDHATRLALLEEYAAGNATVARRHFGRDMLFRDPLPAPDAPVASQALPADSYALMRDFLSPLLRDLMDQVESELDKARKAAETPAGPGKPGLRPGPAKAGNRANPGQHRPGLAAAGRGGPGRNGPGPLGAAKAPAPR